MTRIIGYDARCVSEALRSVWTPARRQEFLLRTDVEVPLSTDPLVWPSVVDWGLAPDFTPRTRHALMLDGLPVPEQFRNERNLWPSLPDMMARLESQPLDERFVPYWTIAICTRTRVERTPPGANAERLGYDVSDSCLQSVVSHSGYTVVEARLLRNVWRSRLNRWHLFDDHAEATRFATSIADLRSPEYGPFQIYGVWRLT